MQGPILTKHCQETPPCGRIIQLFKIIKFQNISFKIKIKRTNTRQTKIRRFSVSSTKFTLSQSEEHFRKANMDRSEIDPKFFVDIKFNGKLKIASTFQNSAYMN